MTDKKRNEMNNEKIVKKELKNNGFVFISPDGHRVVDFTQFKKNIITKLKKHKNKFIAAGVALTLAINGLALYTIFKNKDKQPVKKGTVIEQDEDELAAQLAFDIHSEEEMVNRITDMYVEAVEKNLNGPNLPPVTVEQWMDFYLVSNITNISPTKFYSYISEEKSVTTIMKNFDYVCNLLLEHSITATPDTLIDVSSLIGDRVSAIKLQDFQNMLATYNIASDNTQKQVADQINQYLYEDFVTMKRDNVTSETNLIRLKMLRATWELTVNHSWTVPSKDLSKILYPTENCNLISETNGLDAWNENKAVVKQILEEKLTLMYILAATMDSAELETKGISTYKELVTKIKDEISARGPVTINSRPSSEEAIKASKPKPKPAEKVNIPNAVTVEERKNIVTNPETGKKELHLPPTKENSKETITKQIEDENKKEELRVQGVKDGAQDGNFQGYIDGASGKVKNSKPTKDLTGFDTAYADAYRETYEKYYEMSYAEGLKLEAGTIEKETIEVDEKQQKRYEREKKKLMIDLGKKDGYAAGYDRGYEDGYEGDRYNDRVRIDRSNKNVKNYYDEDEHYTEAYDEAYEEGYEDGYDQGLRDYEIYEEEKKSTSINDDKKGEKTSEKTSNENKEEAKEDSEYAQFMMAEGKKLGSEDGDQAGYDAGLNGLSQIPYPEKGTRYNAYDSQYYKEAYEKAFNDAFTKAYLEGFEDGKKYGILPEDAQIKNNQNENKTQETKQNNSSTQYERIEENGEIIEIIPGFKVKDGRLFDKDGNEVDEISYKDVNENIAALKSLKDALVRMEDTKENGYTKVKTI